MAHLPATPIAGWAPEMTALALLWMKAVNIDHWDPKGGAVGLRSKSLHLAEDGREFQFLLGLIREENERKAAAPAC